MASYTLAIDFVFNTCSTRVMGRPASWTQEEDDILLGMISEDKSFREISLHLNRTRNACIGRMHRLANKLDNQ